MALTAEEARPSGSAAGGSFAAAASAASASAAAALPSDVALAACGAKLHDGMLLDDDEFGQLAALQAEQQRGARAAWR